jgi:hypothetical protein
MDYDYGHATELPPRASQGEYLATIASPHHRRLVTSLVIQSLEQGTAGAVRDANFMASLRELAADAKIPEMYRTVVQEATKSGYQVAEISGAIPDTLRGWLATIDKTRSASEWLQATPEMIRERMAEAQRQLKERQAAFEAMQEDSDALRPVDSTLVDNVLGEFGFKPVAEADLFPGATESPWMAQASETPLEAASLPNWASDILKKWGAEAEHTWRRPDTLEESIKNTTFCLFP